MRVRLGTLALAALVLSACAVQRTPSIQRIALLAPFEGRYREVGYNALYAARLALRDVGNLQLELFPVDDGGTPASAADRAEALRLDPLVKAAVVLGYSATDEAAQEALGGLPTVVVGHWDAEPQGDSVVIAANPELARLTSLPPRVEVTEAARLAAPLVGSDLLGLEQFARLRESRDGVTLVTSGQLPDAAFAERYRSDDSFAPEPGLLAMLTYDVTRMAAEAIMASGETATRENVWDALLTTTHPGLSGPIRFENGYWAGAPIHYFTFDDHGRLIAAEPTTEG